MKPFLILCAVALLGAPLSAVDAGSPAPSRNQAGPIVKARPRYWDMTQAYENGRLDDARRLARAHLVRSLRGFARARNDGDKESVVRETLGIIESMLTAENTLPSQARMGGDLVLLRYVRDTLVQTQSVASTLNVGAPEQNAVARESGMIARLWLRAAAAQLPRTELVGFYQTFQDQLRRAGLNTLDAALAEPAPSAGPIEPVAASPPDTAGLMAVVRDYFTALATGDTARLASATGLDATRGAALIAERDQDYRRDGLRAVTNVTVPTPPTLLLRAMGTAGSGMYSFTVRGIVMNVVLVDGTATTRTIEKYFRARKDATGRWTIVISS